ncbi:Uncharacterised protein [Mycoplasmopsis maculosa]|uniref:F5/8 type C domain-containing protein n=1 Tax=Mycoplasmopsis maculosa TaxID=114885 RepID=A0A449B3L0_9BACT|nr:discoidin domain-containing protein [Mycoplasmopsis maculosa]VEU75183.1 Uncharacterised protein [Mycoplasmopsis maculosa]
MKIKTTLLLSSFALPFCAVISCSYEDNLEKPTPEPNKPNDDKKVVYEKNNKFVNIINTGTDNTVFGTNLKGLSPEQYKFSFTPIFKVFKGEKFNYSELPDNIKVMSEDGKVNWFKTDWNIQKESDLILEDTVIEGKIKVSEKFINIKAVILISDKPIIKDNEYKNRNDGLTIDLSKSTKYNSNILYKLIDKNGNYFDSPSRWDNWEAFAKEQDDNYFVFKYAVDTKISKVSIIFWRFAERGNSSGILPKEIRIQYSNDGLNWINVENQDKITDLDLGPMEAYSDRFNNISKPKNIKFDEIQTQWVRIYWVPKANENGEKHIIGVSDIQFSGLDFKESVIVNTSNVIKQIKYGENTYEIDESKKSYTFKVNDFKETFSLKADASYIDNYLYFESSNTKKYKVIVYNDNSESNIYDFEFKK